MRYGRQETWKDAVRDYVWITVLAIGLILASIVPSMAEPEAKEEAEKPATFECPYSHISDQDMCFKCHGEGYDFKKIKETDPHDLFSYPAHLTIYEDEAGKYGYYELSGEISDYVPVMMERAFRYLDRHKVNRVVIDINSPGGSVFAGWKVVAVINEYEARGMDVITQVRSVAASAAFTIFCAPKKRLISPVAELMQHELWTFKFFSFDTPSDKEHEAKILRHIQDTITSWLAAKANMKKEDLAEKLKKKEYWLNGAQAKKIGWATGYTFEPENEAILLDSVEEF